MSKFMNSLTSILLALLVSFSFVTTDAAAKTYKIGVSVYAGWMPWYYAKQSGIMDKWAKRYNVDIEIETYSEYMPSVGDFTSGALDGCAMTNLEALNSPAAGNVDCSAIITGDYSNGNDAILVKDNLTFPQLVGQTFIMEEGSVSQFLTWRALEMNGLDESMIHIKNIFMSDNETVFRGSDDIKVSVTWNPIVMSLAQDPRVTSIFTSAQIPGEILDLMVVRTSLLKENPDVAKALVGAWYEIMSIMQHRGNPTQRAAIQQMAEASPCSVPEYENQLRTTMMYYNAQDAVDFTQGSEIKDKMIPVHKYCVAHGLFGKKAIYPDNAVGIQYPDGEVRGDKDNVQFRFNTEFMQMAADGKL